MVIAARLIADLEKRDGSAVIVSQGTSYYLRSASSSFVVAAMSDPTTSSAAGGSEPSQFTLQILSPSINVPQPLCLSIPVTATVRQLRERIRESVNTRPSDDAQRLIHRGRLLGRDSETMLELFGEEPVG